MSDVPSGVCARCKRPLDDHCWRTAAGAWLEQPRCMSPEDVKNGVKAA